MALEMAKDLTRTLVETGKLSAEDMQDVLHKTHATLTALKAQEATGPAAALSAVQPPTVDWRTSITRHAVTCLECGHVFKQLMKSHLRHHGLDSRSYRVKYGIPRLQSLVSWKTSTRRRQVVRQIRPWEKAPAYLQRHAQNTTASPAPKVETVPETTEEPSAEAPAQPKRQWKTAPK